MANINKINQEREETISLIGNKHISGDIYAKSFSSSGNITISGILDAFEINISGLLETSSIITKKLKVNGNLTVSNEIVSEEKIESNGLLTVHQMIKCDF